MLRLSEHLNATNPAMLQMLERAGAAGTQKWAAMPCTATPWRWSGYGR